MALLKISVKVKGVLYQAGKDEVPEEIINLLPALKKHVIEDGKATSKKSKRKGTTSNTESSENTSKS
jgi:non-homologous end joining protein Ku